MQCDDISEVDDDNHSQDDIVLLKSEIIIRKFRPDEG